MPRCQALLLMVLVVAGCSSGATASPPRTSPALATAAVSTAVVPTAAVPTAPGDGPPAGLLAAEGGDPVTGQLGTFAWGDGGSDSPWLPGAPIAVGAGEPLAVSFGSPIGVATWRARAVSADADGPAGATILGEGTGAPAFGAPAAGSWTAEVHVVFEGGVGDASYFWRLEVT